MILILREAEFAIFRSVSHDLVIFHRTQINDFILKSGHSDTLAQNLVFYFLKICTSIYAEWKSG